MEGRRKIRSCPSEGSGVEGTALSGTRTLLTQEKAFLWVLLFNADLKQFNKFNEVLMVEKLGK